MFGFGRKRDDSDRFAQAFQGLADYLDESEAEKEREREEEERERLRQKARDRHNRRHS